MSGAEPEGFIALGDWSGAAGPRGAVVLLTDAAGRILVQLRDDRPGVAAAGLWGLFGGGVEAGENLDEAACREIAEETGVRLDPHQITPFARVVTSGRVRVRLYVFRSAQTVEPGEIRLGEGAGFAFLNRAQTRTYPMVPEMHPVLDLHDATGGAPVSPGGRDSR